MAPTIEDLFEFMKQDRVERAKERERDKQEIKELVSQGINTEVKSLLTPLEERVLSVENTQANVMSQLKEIVEDMKGFKEQLVDCDKAGDKDRVRLGQGVPASVAPRNVESSGAVDHEEEKVSEIISHARRTVGLDRIDKTDLERMRQSQYGGATNQEEEQLLAVQEYLRCELKIGSEMQQNMEIENIFPAYGEDPTHMYVTFKQESSVRRIFEKTRIMSQGSRIVNFIPRQFKERSRAIGEIEYKLRKEENYQTRVKMGLTDLELWKKERGMNHKWERVVLPRNLPPIDLYSPVSRFSSSSPPPGRPLGHAGKRGRESSGSESGQKQSKAAKQDGLKGDKVETWSDIVKNANLVSEESTISPLNDGEGLMKRIDFGHISSVQGTPAKTLQVLEYEASPVLSRSSKN